MTLQTFLKQNRPSGTPLWFEKTIPKGFTVTRKKPFFPLSEKRQF